MSATDSPVTVDQIPVRRVPAPAEASRARQAMTAVVVGSLTGFIAAGLGERDGGARLSFAWLLSAWFLLSIALGAICFVAVQHLTRAGWSVTLRRAAEIVGMSITFPAAMLLPLAAVLWFGHSELFPWNDPETVASSSVLAGKAPWLNRGFFTLRTVLYVGIWVACSSWLFCASRRQDTSRNVRLTLTLERRSAVILILLAVTITFAAFDWLMSLDPMWFSTIFGIYLFSGSMVAALAVLTLIAAVWIRNRPGDRFVTVEHLHDTAKLLYGFNCFWAYIAFSQYLLIWYANIPEETVWFQHRQHGGWEWVSLLLIVGHFVIPFLGLMSRHVKRRPIPAALMAGWLLLMHWADLYWIIYPNLAESPVFGSVEVLGLFFVLSGAVLATWLLVRNTAVIPLHDPRLHESVSHHVV